MKKYIPLVSLLVSDYDDAIAFYTEQLGFRLVEDTLLSDEKRWVVVAPDQERGCSLLLAKAADDRQRNFVGNQTGGRVFLFLYTSDFWKDFETMKSRGVVFIREPVEEVYGIVAVFRDLYGNLWDLLEPK